MPRRRSKPATLESELGARIASLRKQRAMSQVQLAGAIGMDQSLLSRYERGVVCLHSALLVDLARTLEVSTDELLGVVRVKQGAAGSDRRVIRRFQQIEQLPRRKKEILLATIDSFLRGESVGRRSAS